MTFQRSCVLQCAAMLLIAVLAGCNDDGKKAGGGDDGKRGIQGPQWVAGACNLSSTGNCNGPNTCAPGTSCSIDVTPDGNGGVNVKLNGQPLANPDKIVCAAQGAAITWTSTPPPPPPTQHFSFLLDFGNVAPITSGLTYANGSDTQPATSTFASANGCYKYNVKVCPIPPNPGPAPLACGEIDPKIIIGSGGTLTKQK